MKKIVEEAGHRPPEKVRESVGCLAEDLLAREAEVESAWRNKVARRIGEIQSGKIQGVPGEEVSARVRKIIGR